MLARRVGMMLVDDSRLRDLLRAYILQMFGSLISWLEEKIAPDYLRAPGGFLNRDKFRQQSDEL